MISVSGLNDFRAPHTYKVFIVLQPACAKISLVLFDALVENSYLLDTQQGFLVESIPFQIMTVLASINAPPQACTRPPAFWYLLGLIGLNNICGA